MPLQRGQSGGSEASSTGIAARLEARRGSRGSAAASGCRGSRAARCVPAWRWRSSMFWVISASQQADLLELGERLVAGVGLRARRASRASAAGPGLGRMQALAPGLRRVAQEALVAVERRLAVLRPETAGAAEGRDAALDREARRPSAPPRERAPASSAAARAISPSRAGVELEGRRRVHAVQVPSWSRSALAARAARPSAPRAAAGASASASAASGSGRSSRARRVPSLRSARASPPARRRGGRRGSRSAGPITSLHEEQQGINQIARNGDRREDQHDRAIGPGERVGEQHAVDRARRAERRSRRRAADRDAERRRRNAATLAISTARADAADQVEAQEALRAPGHRERRAEHPEREHVQRDVAEPRRAATCT